MLLKEFLRGHTPRMQLRNMGRCFNMKRMTLLVAVLLALLLPLSVLADAAPPAAPEALDMTAPLEAAEYQFDFLPWFTTFDDRAGRV